MLDGIVLEKAGVPSASIVTDVFELTGRAMAEQWGVPTYRFLRRYLERRLPAPLTLRQVDPLIRQLTLYRDLIDRKTGDPL